MQLSLNVNIEERQRWQKNLVHNFKINQSQLPIELKFSEVHVLFLHVNSIFKTKLI